MIYVANIDTFMTMIMCTGRNILSHSLYQYYKFENIYFEVWWMSIEWS